MIKKISRVALMVLCALLCSFVFAHAATAQKMQNSFEEELYDNVIRFHVIANSDSAEDQRAKLFIKDQVLSYVSRLLEDASCVSDAESIIAEHQGDILSYTKKICDLCGYNYMVNVDFSSEHYPVRYYEGFSFPAGNYKSLRIELGYASGKNWWCVLYPAVCTGAATDTKDVLEKGGVSDGTAEYIVNGEKYKIEFFLLELFGF